MSVAAYRVRKRVKGLLMQALQEIEGTGMYPIPDSLLADSITRRDAYGKVLSIIDEELEREAERAFTQPLNPQIG